ncbi:alpha/beta hydrolase [Spirosoma oryzicola]|uniref:alpha/beta hydrolase n=1 Tax=Spirosoma oryzicola TaxID=2898794 RepID=UPI001E4B0080|nr:alpha/beta hydrolase-fold protein [Spirosoma oryzicola]UHG89097.1 carbohydrate esterase [Spirosoma oryzicola]
MASPLRFELTTPVLDDRPVYVSGNFCGWHPNLDSLRLWPTGPGCYALDLPAEVELPDVLEYKFTRGGWDQAELDLAGDVPPNRVSQQKNGVLRAVVPHWRWFGHAYNPHFLPKLGMIDEEFAVPQLQTTRRVRVLVPYDYDDTDKRYPVLYLQDGQNLIGAGSAYGSWEIDRRLAVLASRHHHELIVVAIDHGAENRLIEFTPDRTMAGTGEGRKYLDFVACTLKPAIDSLFRTEPGTAHTGIGGSSLGGLISLYAGLVYPTVFGRLLIFSPSLWLSRTVFTTAARGRIPAGTKWYLYGGESESASMVPGLKRFVDALRKPPQQQRMAIQLATNPQGTHSESCWGNEFPAAVEWLFY